MKKRTLAMLSMGALMLVEVLWAAGGTSSIIGNYFMQPNGKASFAGNRITISGSDSELHIRQISLMQDNPKEILNYDAKCPNAGGPCQIVEHHLLGRSDVSNLSCKSEREGDKFAVEMTYEMRANGKKSQRYIYSPGPDKGLQIEYVYTEIYPASTRISIDNRGHGQTMKRE